MLGFLRRRPPREAPVRGLCIELPVTGPVNGVLRGEASTGFGPSPLARVFVNDDCDVFQIDLAARTLVSAVVHLEGPAVHRSSDREDLLPAVIVSAPDTWIVRVDIAALLTAEIRRWDARYGRAFTEALLVRLRRGDALGWDAAIAAAQCALTCEVLAAADRVAPAWPAWWWLCSGHLFSEPQRTSWCAARAADWDGGVPADWGAPGSPAREVATEMSRVIARSGIRPPAPPFAPRDVPLDLVSGLLADWDGSFSALVSCCAALATADR